MDPRNIDLGMIKREMTGIESRAGQQFRVTFVSFRCHVCELGVPSRRGY
jgi:hypothetical protein